MPVKWQGEEPAEDEEDSERGYMVVEESDELGELASRDDVGDSEAASEVWVVQDGASTAACVAVVRKGRQKLERGSLGTSVDECSASVGNMRESV